MNNKIISDISDYIFVHNKPESVDVVFVVGGSLPDGAEFAAKLWKKHLCKFIIIGGGTSIKSGEFKGPKSKKDIYCKKYDTEYDFYKDVLLLNGVDSSVIYGENKSSYTKQNAEFAKTVTDENNLDIKSAAIICKSFHARRCLLFYQLYFPDVDFLLLTYDGFGISKENWYKSDYGIERVFGELKRITEQISDDEFRSILKR